MDRRVKERLIGATILVGLVVLFVPEFLAGPHAPVVPVEARPGASARTYTVDIDHIATAPPAPAVQAPAAAAQLAEPAPALAPVAAVAAEQARVPEAKQVLPPRPTATATQPASAPRPKPLPSATPAQAGALGWTVQAGSFASKLNADAFVGQLRAEGFTVFVSPIGTAAATRYRVRLGPFADRTAAAGVIAKLQAHRHASTLVPPNE